ncbi:MAG: hypothetical protein WC408_02490 [Candidatus Micrarchaeia archaeon]|jgi:hypothetical protein
MLPKCRQVEFTSSIVEHMNPNWGQLKGIEVSLRSQGLKRMKKIRPSIINSPDFAEFVGILLGDGHIERKTVVITLNNRCENEYAEYVCSLVEKLFGKKPSKFVRGNGSCICVFVHSTELAAFLAKQGIPLGARKLQTIHIPCVFMENEVLTRCFVRGLVDTDGGVFRKSRHDMRLLIEFKNLNKSLLNLFLMGTKRLGFHPSSSGGNALRIQTQAEVHRYAREVGFSNHKNLIRYSQWTQQ